MFGSFKVLKGLGIVGGVLAAGAAAGAALMLKRWADDPEASDLRVVVTNGKGIRLSKTEDGRVVVDTHYNASEDEAVRGVEEPAGPVLVVDVPEKVKAFATKPPRSSPRTRREPPPRDFGTRLKICGKRQRRRRRN